MANSASARKSARQAAARRLLNAGLRSEYRTAVKSVRKAVATGDAKAASDALRAATSTIDRIAAGFLLCRSGAKKRSTDPYHRGRLRQGLGNRCF